MQFTFILLLFLSCVVIHQSIELQNDVQNNDILTDSEELLKTITRLKNDRNGTVLNNAVCEHCQLVVNHFLTLRKSGATKEQIAKELKIFCTKFLEYHPKMCKGLVNIEIDTVLFIVDNRQNLTAERICAIYLQINKCVDPDAKKWIIPLPPLPDRQIEQQNAEDSTTFRILHVTDIHFDPLYKPGSKAICDEELCCRSGIPVTNESAAGYWGDYNVCDMPWHSVQNLMDFTNNLKPFDHVYYTGDIISHSSWSTSKINNTKDIKAIYKLFKDTFQNISVYPILGNHEPHPTDFYSPLKLSDSKVATTWLLDLVAEQWSVWLPESTKDTIKRGGFYTVLIKPGFRIIALNSNVCFTFNIWLFYDDEDPYGQLKWLVEELTKAEENNEKVHLLSHIPPGEITCHKQWSNQFRRIIDRFSKTISAQFNGHTHYDELRVFYGLKNDKEIVNVAFNGGSFTTFVGLNPNVRVYEVNISNYMVADYHHFTYNITKANLTPNKPPKWYKLYSFKDAYKMSDLGLKSFESLIVRLKNPNLIWKYFRFQGRDSEIQLKKGCDKECLEKLLCHIKAVETTESIDCV